MRGLGCSLVLLGVLASAPALAAGDLREAPAPLNGTFVTGDLGWFDLGGDRSPSLQIEFNQGLRYWSALPSAGPTLAPGAAPGLAQAPGGIGVGIELPVGESFSFTPSLAAGVAPRADAIEPVAPLEFRSGAELTYQFSNDWKVGAAYFHVTNGGLTSGDTGNNVVTFTFTVPFGR